MFEDYKKNPKNKNFLPNSYVMLDISIGDKKIEKSVNLKVSFLGQLSNLNKKLKIAVT